MACVKSLDTSGGSASAKVIDLFSYRLSGMSHCTAMRMWKRLVSRSVLRDSRRFRKIDRTECAGVLEGPVSNQEVYNYWYQKLVPPYCKRELTNLNDRLPALSGIASKFSLQLNDDYLAGLWRRDLVTGLAWETDTPGRNLLERAPSWSWASVEGPISFSSETAESSSMEMALEVLDVQLVTNTTGMIQKGSLHVSGMMCMAFLNIDRHKCSLIRKDFENERDTIIYESFDISEALSLDTPLSVVDINTSGSKSLYSLQRSFDEPALYTQTVSGNVLCVLLCQHYFQEIEEVQRIYLILGASSTELGVYYRLGIATLTSGEHPSVWFEDMSKDAIIIK